MSQSDHCRALAASIEPSQTHCIDCRFAVLRGAELCTNPAVIALDDEQRAQYDDAEQPCPCFEAKENLRQ